MNSKHTKLFIGILIFLAYISIGVFGLFQFSHASETPMVNCPYAVGSYSVCDSSINHINHWQQFSNITFTPLFIFSLLILGLILYAYNQRSFLDKERHLFYKWKYYIDNKISYAYLNKIIKWLSLFENSPPVRVVFF